MPNMYIFISLFYFYTSLSAVGVLPDVLLYKCHLFRDTSYD